MSNTDRGYRARRVTWRNAGDRYTLHLGRSKKALLEIVPDKDWGGMWRVLHQGELSDMVNLTRAKDAGMKWALDALNGRP